MKPRNRLHSHTRWPNDKNARLALAQTDLAFCEAIARIEFPLLDGGGVDAIPSLVAIRNTAHRIIDHACPGTREEACDG
jgi:hypothetical protein